LRFLVLLTRVGDPRRLASFFAPFGSARVLVPTVSGAESMPSSPESFPSTSPSRSWICFRSILVVLRGRAGFGTLFPSLSKSLVSKSPSGFISEGGFLSTPFLNILPKVSSEFLSRLSNQCHLLSTAIVSKLSFSKETVSSRRASFSFFQASVSFSSGSPSAPLRH
jgi:hypothetical protein